MKQTITLTLILLLGLAVPVPGATDDDRKSEGNRQINHLHDLYNLDLNDSLIALVPVYMNYQKANALWDNYYEAWMLLVNTHTFMGNVNTALQEVNQMHKDATDRHDNYGLALANYAMGNSYNNMGYLDEAIGCYDQSIRLIEQCEISPSVVCDIYSYYCDALNEKGDYARMGPVTERWSKYIDWLARNDQQGEEPSNTKVWKAYYHLACAQRDLGIDSLDAAERHIDEADKRKDGSGEFIMMSVLYYRAQLYLKRKDYAKALELNTARMKKSQGYDDKSSLALIYEQRAEILQGMARYEEALNMMKDLRHLTDSLYKKDTRTQINELNTLFRVSEIDMERRLQRNRYATWIAIIIALALAMIVGYGYWMNRRLRRKNEELAVARDQAQESSRMKSDFIKNISHEIRTPLNILSGFTQIIALPDAELPQEVRQEASEKIQENTNRITTLINQLLALSESHSLTHIERTDTVSVNQLCRSAIQASGIEERATHRFTFESEVDDAFTVLTSERYLVSALGHLLDNAMKFTPEGGSVRMHCRQQGDHIEVSVEDTGCGVPLEKADEIFGEFVQLDEFRDGTGIGLTVARNIARQLGGDIILDTNYNSGARFVLKC